MKKCLLSVLFVLLTILAIAAPQPRTDVISGYKPIYFIVGSNVDQIKIHVSIQYDLFFPHRIGLYLAYSQLMFWDYFNGSGPAFSEVNYNPELVYRLESGNNCFSNVIIPFIDFIQISPFEHLSNGRNNPSFAWNRGYAQVQASVGTSFNFGVSVKGWLYYPLGMSPSNEDITTYTGNFEYSVFLKYIERKVTMEQICARFGFGADASKYFAEIGIMSRTLFTRFKLYVQFFNGYGESLGTYTKTKDQSYLSTAIRAGVVIE